MVSYSFLLYIYSFSGRSPSHSSSPSTRPSKCHLYHLQRRCKMFRTGIKLCSEHGARLLTNRGPDRSGCCLISIWQLPDQSGSCLILPWWLTDRSGSCLILITQRPDQSGSCPILIKQQRDRSGHCLIWIRQKPDRSGNHLIFIFSDFLQSNS